MSVSPEAPRVERVDWFLQVFVQFVNEKPFDMPVTISTGGMLVSGMLASGRDYFEAFADEFARGMTQSPEDVQASWRDFLGAFATSVYGEGDGGSEEESDDPPDDDPHYLHLRDARFFHPGRVQPLPSREGVWWRTRLEAVDGFFFGALRPPSSGDASSP